MVLPCRGPCTRSRLTTSRLAFLQLLPSHRRIEVGFKRKRLGTSGISRFTKATCRKHAGCTKEALSIERSSTRLFVPPS